jgi:hypothetical protein
MPWRAARHSRIASEDPLCSSLPFVPEGFMTRPSVLVALAVVSASALLAASPARAQGKIEPGEWEQVMTMSAPGMPGGSMNRTMRTCFTSSDAVMYGDRDQWAETIAEGASEANCKLAAVEQAGSALVVRLECAGDMKMTMRHDFRGATGTIDAETFVGGESMGKSHVESKRVADTCSEATIAQWKEQNPGKPFVP